MSGLAEIKRRSARIYAEEQDSTSRISTSKKDITSRPTNMVHLEKANKIESSSASKDTKIRRQSAVDPGLDAAIFSKTEEESAKHGEHFYFDLSLCKEFLLVLKPPLLTCQLCTYARRPITNLSKVTTTLHATKSLGKSKEDSHPINHGVVVPGKIFRSSWPKDEDLPYLESLHLKTIL